MTNLPQANDLDLRGRTSESRAAPPWPHRVRHLINVVGRLFAYGVGMRDLRQAPVFRIERLWEDRWIAKRRDAILSRVFPHLEQAVAYVRHESDGLPSTVELRIDDLYIVAQLDPNQPGSLFGETVIEHARVPADEIL